MTLCASLFFFFIDTATTEIYTLSLHDALPISSQLAAGIFRVGPAAHGVAPDRESAGRARRVAARRGQPARLGLHGGARCGTALRAGVRSRRATVPLRRERPVRGYRRRERRRDRPVPGGAAGARDGRPGPHARPAARRVRRTN